MPTPRLTREQLIQALQAVHDHGDQGKAARALGLPISTLKNRYQRAMDEGLKPYSPPSTDPDFEYAPLPDPEMPVEDLLEYRKEQFSRRAEAEDARRLIDVRVKIDGPFAITHFGDPHVDDDYTDIVALERDIKTVRDTEGMFGANVGDLQNNWIGRLAKLWADQSTTSTQAWMLTEWLLTSIPWLFVVAGNHDVWSGVGDPAKWIMRRAPGKYEPYGIRINLNCPNGKQVRINCRHDFHGHSMWNTAHGLGKAVQMGWRDHVLTAGHRHVSGYMILKDPASGLISHAIRCGGYKVFDQYAKAMGLPNQNIFAAATTIIDPRYDDDDPRLVTTLFDVGEAAEFLTWKRQR